MAEVIKIVLTGGPCAGKTKALAFLREEMTKLGEKVLFLPECATMLMEQGKTPQSMGSFAFHSLLFATQLANEEALYAEAEAMEGDRVTVFCDRGLLDNRAYVTAEEFARYAAPHGMSEGKLRNRYDAVLHLVTAADGAPSHYHYGNTVRSETPEKAKALDQKLLSVWTGVNHLRVIRNEAVFSQKLAHLLEEVKAVLGIPEPLEIEIKFLIAMPDLQQLERMPLCRRIPITQAYLTTPQEGRFRIRRRGEGDGVCFIKTVKHKINEMKRVEIETYISEKEYNDYLAQEEYVQGVISKDRYCIVENGTYYELDVYPFWSSLATLEIELLDEQQAYELPSFVQLITEVTFDKRYRNKALAVQYGGKGKHLAD